MNSIMTTGLLLTCFEFSYSNIPRPCSSIFTGLKYSTYSPIMFYLIDLNASCMSKIWFKQKD